MIEKVIGYFRGSLRIRISGFSPERFLNACMHRNIYIWNIQPVQDFYEMNISISDFRMLKPILKKTGVRAVIIKRYGFPFFLFQHRKRKVLFGGAVCAAGFIYLMSLFIWEIDITGNRRYTDEALEACVKLSARYITDRNFPDKAIDALDEAGSRVHLTNINVPKEIEEQEKLIEEARSLKAEAVKSQNFELAASYRDREKELSVRLEEMKVEWEARLKDDRQTVGEEEIANVISMMSGVPVQRMAQAEGLKLAGMKEELQAKVIAQDAAIEKLTKAILRSRVGLKDPNHPIGTFMFLGPTGVGKTHLAKQLAKYMFGSADALIRIDMSEYMEKYTVSRMIGAAPGYVGYEEGGQLTEKVRRKPYSIVLLDEIEKAHPDVFNILLQVLDEGRLTDNYGRTIDFKNTVIIMTSNIGTRQLKEFGRGVGFAAQNRTDDNEHSRSVIQKALNKTFAPEFLNRLDEIITFDQLSLEAITKIVDIELKGLYERVEAIGYKLVVEDDAKTFLASKGYDVQFGARPLKRAIQNHLEDGLSELIVAEELQPGDTVNVSVDKEKDELSIRKA